MRRAHRIGYALGKGFTITLADVDARTFNAMRLIDAEVDKYRAEQRSREQQKNREKRSVI